MKQIVGLADADFWLTSLRAGTAFSAGGSLEPAVGGVSEVQLLNPVGSGVVVLVYILSAVVPPSTLALWNRYDTALPTLVSTGVNLLLGGAGGAAQVRSSQPAAVEGTEITSLRIQDPSPLARYPAWIFEMAAGTGVLLTTGGQNTRISAQFMWIELPA